jgi:hypothetical protein
VLDNILHDLTKGLEGLALSAWWGTRLQTNLGDDQRLSCNGC